MMLKLLYASWLLLYVCSVFAQISQEEGNLLRILVVADWGKGGNSGTYMSSYNLTNRNLSVSDESDLFEEKSIAGSNVSLLGKNSSGNSGGTKQSLFQPQVAKAMGNFAAKSNPAPSFVLALGDNFYVNGVSSATDVLWNYLWKDVYHGYTGLNIPWYPVFGNHDYGGSIQAQLDRVQGTDDDLWQFPSTNYSKTFKVPGGEGATVGIVFVDTTTLAPSINKCCNQNGGVSTDEQARRINNQVFHIDRMLHELTTVHNVTWLLVVGHYPIFSAGSSGDIAELQTYLLPLLEKYHVHAYLCGHDHLSSHLKANNMDFFIAGAGSMTDKLVYKTTANLTWGGAGYSAFGFMDVTAKYLTFGIIDTDDVLQYQYTMTNPHSLRQVVVRDPTPAPTAAPNHDVGDDDTWFLPILPVEPPTDDNIKPGHGNSSGRGKSARTRQIIVVSGSLITASGLLVALVYCYGRVGASSNKDDAAAGDAVLAGKLSKRNSVKQGRMMTQPTVDSDEDEEEGNSFYNNEAKGYDLEETGSIDEDSLAGTINPLPVFNNNKSRAARVSGSLNTVSQQQLYKKRRGYHPGARYRTKQMYNELANDDNVSISTSSSITNDSLVLGSDFEPQPLSSVAGTVPYMPVPVQHNLHIQQQRQGPPHRQKPRGQEKVGLTKVVHVPGYQPEAVDGSHRRTHSADL